MKIKKIITIGGGTGSSMLLSGLKKYPVNLAAVVSMADDGGSTGRLRDELGVLPPGDVRQCLVALSESSETLRKLMNYRFENGGLKGHNFGNLFLSALEKITGDFSSGVEEASRILNIKGEVIPVTQKDTHLFVELRNGQKLEGEDQINHNYDLEKIGIKKIYLNPEAKASVKALQKIKEADLIVIGPGNHYCSVLPNLLVSGISEAIKKSKAKVVYNCNLVNKKGHSEKFTLDDYADSIGSYIGKNRVNFVILNIQKPSAKLIEKYKESLIGIDRKNFKKREYQIIKKDILNRQKIVFGKADAIARTRSFIRHDSDKLAKVIMDILNKKI